MPFARIAEEWTHEDQSLPDHLPGLAPNATVCGLTVDTAWHQIDPNQ